MLNHLDYPVTHPLRDVINRMTYRPRWTFALTGSGATLHIGARVPDSTGRYKNIANEFGEITVTSTFDVPPHPPCGSWTRWLFDRIMDVERHEAMEFFRVNGELIYDPHRNNYAVEKWETDSTADVVRMHYSPYEPYDPKAAERV